MLTEKWISDETFCTQSQNYGGKSSRIFSTIILTVYRMSHQKLCFQGPKTFTPKTKNGCYRNILLNSTAEIQLNIPQKKSKPAWYLLR